MFILFINLFFHKLYSCFISLFSFIAEATLIHKSLGRFATENFLFISCFSARKSQDLSVSKAIKAKNYFSTDNNDDAGVLIKLRKVEKINKCGDFLISITENLELLS